MTNIVLTKYKCLIIKCQLNDHKGMRFIYNLCEGTKFLSLSFELFAQLLLLGFLFFGLN